MVGPVESRRILALAEVVAVSSGLAMTAWACAPASREPGTPTGTEPCTAEAATRCAGDVFQRCQGGAWQDQARCTGALVCDEARACVQCDPDFDTTCVSDAVHRCSDDGRVEDLVQTCAFESCHFGRCDEPECPADQNLIYVVDDENRLLTFDPGGDRHTFAPVGPLACPAGLPWPSWGLPATPFAMAVDRRGRAVVSYTSGELFGVDLRDPSRCERLPFERGQQGFELFGMAYVVDAPGASHDRMFAAGGAADLYVTGTPATPPPARLGRIDASGGGSSGGDLVLSALPSFGPLEHPPDLTGTGAGELYGYFPGQKKSFVARLDRETAALLASWPMPALPDKVLAWAFAHFGGRFYVFVSTKAASGAITSEVVRLDPATGEVTTVVGASPYVVVGAGVSTCVPIIIE